MTATESLTSGIMEKIPEGDLALVDLPESPLIQLCYYSCSVLACPALDTSNETDLSAHIIVT